MSPTLRQPALDNAVPGNAPGSPAEASVGPFALVGVDFRRASTHLRERLLLAPMALDRLWTELIRENRARGLVVLATCNRSEWLVATDHPAWTAELMRAQMLVRFREALGPGAPLPQPYAYTGLAAARHVLRVATGFESFVQGEAQVAGQFNRALEAARKVGRSSAEINGLGTVVGRITREAARLGLKGGRARGVHGVALDAVVAWSKEHGLRHPSVAVAGLGEIGRKAAALVEEHLGRPVLRFNRSPKPGAAPLDGLAPKIADGAVDVVVIATGGLVAPFDRAVFAASPGPLLVLDLGIPPQVAGATGAGGAGADWGRAHYVGLDALFAQGEMRLDEQAQAGLAALIDRGVREVASLWRRRDLVTVLEAIQREHDHLLHGALAASLQSVELDDPARDALERRVTRLVRQYTARLIESVHAAAETADLPGDPTRGFAPESAGPGTAQRGGASSTKRGAA